MSVVDIFKSQLASHSQTHTSCTLPSTPSGHTHGCTCGAQACADGYEMTPLSPSILTCANPCSHWGRSRWRVLQHGNCHWHQAINNNINKWLILLAMWHPYCSSNRLGWPKIGIHHCCCHQRGCLFILKLAGVFISLSPKVAWVICESFMN